MPIGNAEGTVYYIKELTAPDGYYLDKNTYAVVLKTANATVSIDNEFGKSDFNEYPYGHATIIKEWKLDNSTADMTADEIAQMKAELEKGLYFTVKNSNGKYITATGADGVYKYNSESATEFRYILKNGAFVIAELPTGEYTVTEYSALPDYTIKSENPVKITVVRNQTAKATFVNERDTGTGKVIKVWNAILYPKTDKPPDISVSEKSSDTEIHYPERQVHEYRNFSGSMDLNYKGACDCSYSGQTVRLNESYDRIQRGNVIISVFGYYSRCGCTYTAFDLAFYLRKYENAKVCVVTSVTEELCN